MRTWMLAGLLGLAFPPGPELTGGKILWRDGAEYEAALAEARERGLPTILYFKADYCAPSRVLGNRLWSVDRVVEAAHRMMRIRIDITRLPELATTWKIQGTPTIVLLDANGQVVEQTYVGLNGVSALLEDKLITISRRLSRAPSWARDIAEARAQGRPVVAFWTDGRPGSDEVEQLFSRRELDAVRGRLSWVRLKVVKKGNAEAAAQGVTAGPALRILDPKDGKPTSRLDGAVTVEQVRAALESALGPAK